jgi:hypothetical protein
MAIPGIGQTTQRLGLRPDERTYMLSPLVPGTAKYPTALNLAYGIPGVVETEYPDNSLDDLRYGFRVSKYIAKSMFYLSYFHTQNYLPSPEVTLTGPINYNINLVYPDEDIFGLSMNTEMPKGMIRAEAIYVPNRTFAVWDLRIWIRSTRGLH